MSKVCIVQRRWMELTMNKKNLVISWNSFYPGCFIPVHKYRVGINILSIISVWQKSGARLEWVRGMFNLLPLIFQSHLLVCASVCLVRGEDGVGLTITFFFSAYEHKHLFLSSGDWGGPGQGAGKLGVSWASASGGQKAVVSLCPYLQKAAGELRAAPLIKALVPFRRAPPSGPSHLPKAPPPTTTTLGVEIQHISGGGSTTIGTAALPQTEMTLYKMDAADINTLQMGSPVPKATDLRQAHRTQHIFLRPPSPPQRPLSASAAASHPPAGCPMPWAHHKTGFGFPSIFRYCRPGSLQWWAQGFLETYEGESTIAYLVMQMAMPKMSKPNFLSAKINLKKNVSDSATREHVKLAHVDLHLTLSTSVRALKCPFFWTSFLSST